MIFRFFKKGPAQLAARADVPPGEDPVRRILVIPRGAARLDAFVQTLGELPPGSHGHRGVALAFHRELTTLAKQARVDLMLLKPRVEACAEALLAAGDVERAGSLLAQIGKKRRAAELFVAAGAIDQLEEAHEAISAQSGGAHLSARLCYERFEGLFAVALRAEALEALEEATRLWPENPVYREIKAGFARRVPRGRLRLEVEHRGLVKRITVQQRLPLFVGRGESAALRLTSPVVSREHLEIVAEHGRALVRNLQQRPVTLGGEPLAQPRILEGEGVLDLSGVLVRFCAEGPVLWLWADAQPEVRCAAVLAPRCPLAPFADGPPLLLAFDDEGRAFLEPAGDARLGEAPLQRPLLLLEGDRVAAGALRARVLEG
jgi:tetratricopeptide (TPR) repeat protein